MNTKAGWRRITPGHYRYNSTEGRALAFVRRSRGRWMASVSPVPCSVVDLPDDFRTMREAKALAERRCPTS